MEEKICWVSFDYMKDFMKSVLVASGINHNDAEIVADVLITADKRGIDSHGIGRLKPIYIDRIRQGILNPVTDIEIVKETPTTAVLDGHNGMGHVISHKAMSMAVEKAEKLGMGMVAVRNSTHYGIAGYYTLMATQKGMIGITGTNARPSIAPTFGVENMLGTNPMTFGIPTDEEFPFVLDCATSITQRGKIEVYGRLDKDIPKGWVVDKNGVERTDTKDILVDLTKGDAALLPLGGAGEELGGYKGYGYATVVEILSAALQAGSYLKMLSGFDPSGKRVPYPLGHFFIAIKVEAFTELGSFKKITGDILRDLRNSRKAPGHDRIYTAGEKEYLVWQYRKNKGVPLNESLMNEMEWMRNEYNLNEYTFPWEKE